MSFDAGVSGQTPSLPTAGGATGLGQTFTPDLATGTGSLAVPLDLPNGPNDIGPKLVLRYDSSAGNSAFGLGWSMVLPRISRSTADGSPAYDDGDTLLLEGAGPLVRTPDGLRPQVEGGEWRVEALADGFRVTDRAGTRFDLGTSAGSRVTGAAGGTASWLLARIEDNLGGTADLRWRTDGGPGLLDGVSYGPYDVRFGYEERPDPLRLSRSGVLQVTTLRCSTIELHLVAPPAGDPSLVRRWELGYAAGDGPSRLERVVLTGCAADGSTLSAPALTLSYTVAAPATLTRLGVADERSAPPALLPGGHRVELVDWTGTGTADLVEVAAGGVTRVWPNRNGSWGPPVLAGELPQLAGTAAAVGLVDLDGDGLADLVRADVPAAGYQPRTPAGLARPVAWTRGPSVALGSSGTRLADLDGDGTADVLWGTGRSLLLGRRTLDAAGWAARPDVVPATPGGPPTDLTDQRVRAADMTGDGTTDLVRVDGAGVTYWPYLGRGRFGEPVVMAAPPRLPAGIDPARVLLTDVDGDGCADVVVLDGDAVTWWRNVGGDHFAAPVRVDHVPTGQLGEVRVADVLGTGTPALVWSVRTPSGRGRWFALDLVGGVRPGLLTGVDTGAGRVTTIGWTTSAREAERDRAGGRPWRSRLPVVLPVVASLTVTDVTTGSATSTAFGYHEGRYDGVLREFCGFGRVEAVEAGDEHVEAAHTARWFATGADPDTGDEPGTTARRRRLRAIRGRLLRQELAPAQPDGSQGPVLQRLDHTWRVDDAPGAPLDGAGAATVVTPVLAATTRWTYEGAAFPVAAVVTEQLAFDGAGNVVLGRESTYDLSQVTIAPGDPLPAPAGRLTTHVRYATSAADRFRQRQCRVVQVDGDGTVLADTRTGYDGLPEGQVGGQGLVTSRESLAVTDALAAQVYGPDQPDWPALGYQHRDAVVPGPDAAGIDAVPVPAGWWVTSARYTREVGLDGVVSGTTTDALGAVTRIRMDAAGCYPARVEDAVGNAVEADFDLRSYQPLRLTEPSGQVSRAGFDALARMVTLVEPGDDDTRPGLVHTYDTSSLPVLVTTSRRAGEVDGAELPRRVERHFVDGEGRSLQQRLADGSPGAADDAEVVHAARRYGARGLVVRAWLPYPAPGTGYAPPPDDAPHATMHYDALGRPVRTVRPDGAQARVRYLPGRVELTDEAGRTTVRHLGPDGRVARVVQTLDGRELTTAFGYDLRGSLVAETGPTGAVVRFGYDCLGRLLRTERPEAVTLAVLDAVGNQVESRSGSHRVLRGFDAARRPTTVRHGSAAADPVARFTYHDNGSPAPADAGAHTAGGRLVRVDDEAGSQVLDYDERGRIARKTMSRNGSGPLELTLRHRADGLLDRVAYPDGTLADYRYDRLGRLVSVSDVVTAVTYDLTDRRTSTTYANGVRQDDAHDPLTGWRASTTLLGPAAQVLRHQGFGHDLLGNVTGLTGDTPGTTWTYGYDDLSRLVSATGLGAPGDGTPAAEQTWTWTYDDAGNLLTGSDAGTYRYGEAGAAPTLLTSLDAGAFGYDDRGHLTSAPWGEHSVDDEGRLRRVGMTDGPVHEYTYDHTGRLAVHRVTGTRDDGAGGVPVDVTTWMPDGLLAVEDGVLVLNVVVDGVVVARRAAGPPQPADVLSRSTFLHRDHLGCVVLTTGGQGEVLLAVRYAPFGAVLERTGPAVPQGFATGRVPAAGGLAAPPLVLLGARWYAPGVGRFVSPDALVTDATDPAAWNAYAYCRNNPTSYVDPSGNEFWKIFGAVLATIAIVALVVIVSVVTFGVASPGAVALGVGGISVTWGAVFAATIVGVVAGGVIGGIAAARAGGDAGDIALGVLVGGAVGGWAAFGAAFAGPAVAGGLGLSAGSVGAGAVAGGVSGMINGAAMGFASGFAGGRNNGFKDIMEKVLVGAVVGLAVGAALGALSGIQAPRETPRESLQKAFTPDPPAPGAQGPAAQVPGGAPPAGPPAPVNSLGDAAAQVGKGMAGRVAGALVPHVAAATSGFTGSIVTQTILVDLNAAAVSGFWDDLQTYLRTHDVSLGPFDFIKGDF